MFSPDVCAKLENIIQGTVIKEQPDACTAIRNHLCTSYSTDNSVKKNFESKSLLKKEQEQFLRELALRQNIWINELPQNWTYLTEGGEAKVYLYSESQSVVKINDGVYYATWRGLILEDMHDENVIIKENTLFFIDTVFYVVA